MGILARAHCSRNRRKIDRMPAKRRRQRRKQPRHGKHRPRIRLVFIDLEDRDARNGHKPPGIAQEAALKYLELTSGRIGSYFESPLGFRHGPKSLVDADTRSSGSTRGGRQALAALARAGVDAVLSGHVHDAFDRVVEVEGRSIRIIGAGTLSERLRSSRPSYNRLEWSAEHGLTVDAVHHQ